MIGVGMLFSLGNDMQVPLDLMIYTFEPKSLALWVLLAFALGGVLGIMASTLILFRTRARLNATKRQLDRAREEVSKLRSEAPAGEVL